jgi:1-aminocyclopropane-1-carboxylate deaminase/D-cysteine desulfhydrase-like pyridoxal-dependent ACC family enzyme
LRIIKKTPFFDEKQTLKDKHQKELKEFIETFIKTNQFPIEPTYTGKALYALSAQLDDLEGKNVLFIHTGGVV